MKENKHRFFKEVKDSFRKFKRNLNSYEILYFLENLFVIIFLLKNNTVQYEKGTLIYFLFISILIFTIFLILLIIIDNFVLDKTKERKNISIFIEKFMILPIDLLKVIFSIIFNFELFLNDSYGLFTTIVILFSFLLSAYANYMNYKLFIDIKEGG